MSASKARRSLLFGRADRILGRTSIAMAAGAGAGLLGCPQTAEATIIYSGPVNIPIPVTFGGVYFNVLNGASGPSSGSVPGWDVNPYGSSYLRWFINAGGGIMNQFAGGSSATLIDNLPVGALVDGAQVFLGGTGGNRDVETTGATAFLLNSSNNFIGFRFNNENTATTNFGWMQIQLGATFDDPARAIIGYAYDDAGMSINVGTVPEPSSITLLSLGAAGLIARRRLRRKKAAAAEVA